MSESDDDDILLEDIGAQVAKTGRSSIRIQANDIRKSDAPATLRPADNAKYDIDYLLREQKREQRKIEQVKASSAATTELATGGLFDKELLARYQAMDDEELDRVMHANLSTLEDEDVAAEPMEVDMDAEDFSEWIGLTSVLTCPGAIGCPTLPDFSPAAIAQPEGWDEAYSLLREAIVPPMPGRSDQLADLLCLMGPVRWLISRGLAAPPSLLEWLLHEVALSRCPAVARGAARNLQALCKGTKDGCGPYLQGLGMWHLRFDLLCTLLGYYGVPFKIGAETMAAAAAATRQPSRRGIIPTYNLRLLILAVTNLHEVGHLKLADEQRLELIRACLFIAIDRYIQVEVMEELQRLTQAMLEAIPDAMWPVPAVQSVMAPLFTSSTATGAATGAAQQQQGLSDDSLLQIARNVSLLSGRGCELVGRMCEKLLDERLLGSMPPDVLNDLKAIDPLASPEPYFTTLLNAFTTTQCDALFQRPQWVLRVTYCLELLSKATRSRMPRSFLSTLSKGLATLSQSRVRLGQDEHLQAAKHLLAQEIGSLAAQAPQVGVQTKLSFGQAKERVQTDVVS